MSFFDIQELLQEAAATEIPKICNGGTRRYSFNIINSDTNGKRLSLSKMLIERLGLEDEFQLLPIPSSGVALIGKHLPSSQASTVRLSNRERGTCYSANLVKILTQLFSLDFSAHVSRTFTDITFDEIEGVPVAIITLAKVSKESVEEE